MTRQAEPRALSGGGDWDRYYQAPVGVEPIVGTPGVAQAAFGDQVKAGGGSFTQATEKGFFLFTDSPVQDDPVEVSGALAGVRASGAFAPSASARRRRVRQTASGEHVHVEQLVRGARLIGADARVHRDSEGVFAITGRPLGDVTARDPGPAPTVDTHEAVDTCAQRFELDDGLEEVRVDQVVFPEGDGGVWAYEIGFVVPEHAADVRVYLRADDFSVLLSYNISSAFPTAVPARVYPVNPRRTPAWPTGRSTA